MSASAAAAEAEGATRAAKPLEKRTEPIARCVNIVMVRERRETSLSDNEVSPFKFGSQGRQERTGEMEQYFVGECY